jgi:hypothetical protein
MDGGDSDASTAAYDYDYDYDYQQGESFADDEQYMYDHHADGDGELDGDDEDSHSAENARMFDLALLVDDGCADASSDANAHAHYHHAVATTTTTAAAATATTTTTMVAQMPKRPVGRPRKIRKDREATHTASTTSLSYSQHGAPLASSSNTSYPFVPAHVEDNDSVNDEDGEEQSVDIESTSLEWDSEDGSSSSHTSSSATLPEIHDLLRSSDPFALYQNLEETFSDVPPRPDTPLDVDASSVHSELADELILPAACNAPSHYALLDCFL